MKRQRLDWRRKRSSPAKCLHCGGMNFYLISGNECRDPVTGHEFRFEGIEFYEAALPMLRIRLSPEGDIIELNAE